MAAERVRHQLQEAAVVLVSPATAVAVAVAAAAAPVVAKAAAATAARAETQAAKPRQSATTSLPVLVELLAIPRRRLTLPCLPLDATAR